MVREIPYGNAILPLSCVLGFTIFISLNYPGFMSPDSYDQLMEARNGVYSDEFPPFMALLWRFADKLIPGAFGMLLLQTMLIWLGTYLIAWYWFDGRKFTLFSLAPILIVFLPPIFGISGVIWKDILMWGFLMLAIGFSGSLGSVSPRPRWKNNLKKTTSIATVAATLFLAMLVRYNAGFAAVPIMILCVARASGRLRLNRIASPGIMGLLLSIALQFGAILTTERLSTYHPNEWGFVAIFDIAGVIRRMPERQQQETYYAEIPVRIRGEGSIDSLIETYNSANVLSMLPTQESLLALRAGVGDAVDWRGRSPAFGCAMDSDPFAPPNNNMSVYCFEWTNEEKAALFRIWKTVIMQFPLAWLSHKLSAFRHQLHVDDQPVTDAFFPIHGFRESVDRYDSTHANLIADVNKFQAFLTSVFAHPYTRVPIYRPWFYFLLALVIIGVSLSSPTEERVQIALIAGSGLAYVGGMFLLACSAEYRYYHYLTYTSVLALFLLLKELLTTRSRVP
jgi:hypothetical protein